MEYYAFFGFICVCDSLNGLRAGLRECYEDGW